MSSSTSQSSKRIRKHFSRPDGTPRCGRQLSRPATNAATQSSMLLTQDPGEVGCRHCLRSMGLLAHIQRSWISNAEFSEDSEAEREVDRLLYEQELEEEEEEETL